MTAIASAERVSPPQPSREGARLLVPHLPPADAFTSLFFNEFYTKTRVMAAVSALQDAVALRRPFSFLRLGDAEAMFLRFPETTAACSDAEAAGQGAWLAEHLGVNPYAIRGPVFDCFAEEFRRAALGADILATHRRTINPNASAAADALVRVTWGLDAPYLPNEVDVVFNAELLDQGYLLPLLTAGRVLLLGNAAVEFARLLQDASYRRRFEAVGMPAEAPRVVAAIPMLHEGTAAFDRLEETWTAIRAHEFDLALVAGSIVGKVLAGRIKAECGAVALDIGWNMQYLSGVSSPVAPAADPDYMRKRRGYSRLFQGRTGPLDRM